MKLQILSILLFYLTAAATPAEIDSIKFECPGSIVEFAIRLKAMQDQVSIWTQENPKKADQSDLSSIFSVHLLSEKNTMHLLESSCWVSLNDFIDEPSDKNFEYWNACITRLDLHKVSQFQEIKSCWKTFSKDKSTATRKERNSKGSKKRDPPKNRPDP